MVDLEKNIYMYLRGISDVDRVRACMVVGMSNTCFVSVFNLSICLSIYVMSFVMTISRFVPESPIHSHTLSLLVSLMVSTHTVTPPRPLAQGQLSSEERYCVWKRRRRRNGFLSPKRRVCV